LSQAISLERRSHAARDPGALAALFITLTVAFMAVALILPLLAVFAEALSKGIALYLSSIGDRDALAAVRLTLLVVAISVPLNTIFGIAAAWSVTKFEFRGKQVLLTLIDLPLSISPVISGLVFVLLYGAHGWFGPELRAMGVQIIFDVSGIVIATTLVTLPFVARELIPLMQAQGKDEESAAATLGASTWRTFWQVTLPNIRWALLYGVLLCTARAMGEFGAVSVVSARVRGETATMPLEVEILYNEYNATGAFAVASLLALFALVALAAKAALENQFAGDLAAQRRH
jgi:sulfate/thiosulfate transport system permease protein